MGTRTWGRRSGKCLLHRGLDAWQHALPAEGGGHPAPVLDEWHRQRRLQGCGHRIGTPGGAEGVNARDRIGKGPWQNAKGTVVAKSIEDLHSEANNITKQTALTEKGETVSGRGDPVNMHDILTGSDPQGMFSTAGGDTTCGNWAKSGEGSAIVGHQDRQGLKDTRHMKSWNSSHGSRGCSQDALKSSGGAGLIYCFAAN